MSRDCTICLPEPCKTVDDLDLYSLESPIFPFVLNCPPGSTCNPKNVQLLACCDEDVPVTIPQNANDTEALALLQQALSECARKQLFCGELAELPPPGTPITIYFNNACTAEVECPDGTIFSYTVAAGNVLALSRDAADAAACRHANRLAEEHRVCLSHLQGAICLGVEYSQTIKAKGEFVARSPQTDFWEVKDGTLPTGLTLDDGYQTNGAKLSGTPTMAGTYTFTIRFVISSFGSPGRGDYMEKNYQIKVVGITNTSPLPDAMLGVFYSQALTLSGTFDIDTETWSISSGSLPPGLTLSKRFISGTPTGALAGYLFTVQVVFDVAVILRNGIAGFTKVTCAKAFTLQYATVDLGTITPSILVSLPPTFWDSGNPQPPGRYRIKYENGAMQYALCVPDPCWSVNTIGAGFRCLFFAGSGFPGTLFPALTSVFTTQAAAEAANAGIFIDFDTTVSAAISMRLDDVNYVDNVAGSPNPTFRLFRLSLA